MYRHYLIGSDAVRMRLAQAHPHVADRARLCHSLATQHAPRHEDDHEPELDSLTLDPRFARRRNVDLGCGRSWLRAVARPGVDDGAVWLERYGRFGRDCGDRSGHRFIRRRGHAPSWGPIGRRQRFLWRRCGSVRWQGFARRCGQRPVCRPRFVCGRERRIIGRRWKRIGR